MGLELPEDVRHLVAFKVAYNRYEDCITFLPFVYSQEERGSELAFYERDLTPCGTVTALYLRRSGNLAGMRIKNVSNVLPTQEKEEGKTSLTGFSLLACAVEHVKSHLNGASGTGDFEAEVEKVKEHFRYEALEVPEEVANSMPR